MKANEFVKEYGLVEAKKIVDGLKVDFYFKGIKTSPVFTFDDGEYWISYDDLKHLVESHELVNSYGGVAGAKKYCNYLADANEYFSSHETNLLFSKIKLAIADVESCQ